MGQCANLLFNRYFKSGFGSLSFYKKHSFYFTFELLTRWALLAELPILFGAILINFIGVMNTSKLIEVLVIFTITVFFIFYGSGNHSADYNENGNLIIPRESK